MFGGGAWSSTGGASVVMSAGGAGMLGGRGRCLWLTRRATVCRRPPMASLLLGAGAAPRRDGTEAARFRNAATCSRVA